MSEEQSSVQNLTSQSLRADRPGRGLPYNQLITIKTMDASVTALPLRRYQLIIDAALSYRPELLKADPEMLERMRVIDSLAYSFLLARDHAETGRVSMVWNFQPGDYDKYVSQWTHGIAVEWLPDSRDEQDQRISRDYDLLTEEAQLIAVSHSYSVRTFDSLRNAFLVWADPIIADLKRMIGEFVGMVPKAVLESMMVNKKHNE